MLCLKRVLFCRFLVNKWRLPRISEKIVPDRDAFFAHSVDALQCMNFLVCSLVLLYTWLNRPGEIGLNSFNFVSHSPISSAYAWDVLQSCNTFALQTSVNCALISTQTILCMYPSQLVHQLCTQTTPIYHWEVWLEMN